MTWMRVSLVAALLAASIGLAALPVLGQSQDLMVADVRIEGARRQPEQTILNMLKTRPGRPYNPAEIQDDIRRLMETNWFADVRPAEARTAEGVVVIFRVVERPTIKEVIYEGAKHLSRKELEELTGLRPGGPMDPALNWRAREAIQRKYHEKGRLLARVDLVEGKKSDDLRVVFRITEGPVIRINSIRFEGNHFVSDARLKTQIESRATILGFFGEYDPEQLDNDVLRLLKYYHTFGFFEARIGRKVFWHAGTDRVDVVFVIEEGPRSFLANSEVTGNRLLDANMLLAHDKAEKGQPYNANIVQASARDMRHEYWKRGYIFADVQPVVKYTDEPGVATVVYQVNEGPLPQPPQPYRVGEIRIIGNTVTQDRVIRRELIGLEPGQIFDRTAIVESERNLSRLRIFKEDPVQGIRPTITILNENDPSPYKDILVQVEEDRTGSLLIGAAFSTDYGANLSIVLNERNFDIFGFPRLTSWDDFWADLTSGRAFRGAGQELRIEAIPGTEVSRYSISWREPRLFDSPYSLGVGGYYYTRIFDEYTEQRTGGRITIGRRLWPEYPEWSFNVGFRIEDVKVYSFPPNAPLDFQEVAGHNFVFAPRLSVVRDTRDSIIRPTTGSFLELAYEHGLGDFNYPILTAEGSKYWTVYERPDGSGRHVLAARGIVGWAGDDTPLYDRFYAGGFRTLRGFRFRGVGPRINGLNVGGTFEALGSVEYQIPLLANDMIYAVAFTDFGTVDSEVSFDKFRVSTGVGLRINVPMLGPAPIALDWGFPIVREPGDLRRVFFFGIAFNR
ncbi:MAG: BamA/TamA family outer membrane protein [Gemmatales bacterium]|nr:BamA/TamA family outer membrane protein [Gemmatales bacterium]MDW8176815.1 BamA/TamA family outer membrane protein [Gemmatales bacterium]